jgi:hypothetical protein
LKIMHYWNKNSDNCARTTIMAVIADQLAINRSSALSKLLFILSI